MDSAEKPRLDLQQLLVTLFYRARALMRSAERRSGLASWGDTEFIARMDAWLTAADRDAGLNDIGRANLQAFALRYAMNRLRLEALIERHPGIETMEIAAPIVVTGLPRSGTTALVTLLAAHPGLRSLPMWEASDPFSDAPAALRRQRAYQVRDGTMAAMPALAKLHDFKPCDLADDQELQGLAFGSYMLEWHAHAPEWRDHYLGQDQSSVYRYLRKAMRALAFLRGPRRWIIKCPQHVEQLSALKAVFPDALLVVTARQRAAVDKSMARLIAYTGQVTRKKPFPPRYWPERFDRMRASYERDAHLFPDRVELNLADWSADPEGTRERVHFLANLQA